jgi:hypothetical protein
MISLVVASVGSVIVLLAIEGLTMGRDVANNTRAMREYLRRIGGEIGWCSPELSGLYSLYKPGRRMWIL